MPAKNNYSITKSICHFLKRKKFCWQNTINSFKTTAKTHETTDEKITIPFSAEHLHFLLTRFGWKVTKIRGHYTFEEKN